MGKWERDHSVGQASDVGESHLRGRLLEIKCELIMFPSARDGGNVWYIREGTHNPTPWQCLDMCNNFIAIKFLIETSSYFLLIKMPKLPHTIQGWPWAWGWPHEHNWDVRQPRAPFFRSIMLLFLFSSEYYIDTFGCRGLEKSLVIRHS
jgi:hypothetical protein